MGIEQSVPLLQTTLEHYHHKHAGPTAFRNEVLRLTAEFQELIGSNRVKVSGGSRHKFGAMLDRVSSGGPVDPKAKRSFEETKSIVNGYVDWSWNEFKWLIYDADMALNENAGEDKLLDLVEVKEEELRSDAAMKMEEMFWDPVGGMDHYNDNDRPFPGLKAWVTRTGRAVGGDTPNNVFAIDVSKHPRWLNRYAGPLGSNLNPSLAHTATDSLTSAGQLPRFLSRAMRMTKFKAPSGARWAKDEAAKESMRKLKIYCDEIAYDSLEKLLRATGHGADQVKPAELLGDDPVVKNVPLTFVEDLGLGSAGLPAYTAISTDGGDLSSKSGSYTNTGEVYVCNMNFWGIAGLADRLPNRQKLAWLGPTIPAVVQVVQYVLATLCLSRQRQVCLWGFKGLK